MFIEADNLDAMGKDRGKEMRAAGSDTTALGPPVRRPYRGIQVKEDTYAFMSIYASTGEPVLMVSESSTIRSGDGYIGQVAQYADFIIQNVEEARSEKMQIIETFGDPYIYFYGEKPRFVTFGGVLVNSEDFNWRSQFWYNYENYLRGTKLVQRNARAYLSYDSIVIEGYPITASATDDANAPHLIPFRLTMLVTNYYDYSSVGDVRFPGHGQVPNAVINQELDAIKKQRDNYVSTGAQVRYRNLTASLGGSSLLGEIRQGIGSFKGALGDLVDQIHSMVGGRVVRLPIGIAGYLHATGAAVVAAGSIGSKANLEMYNKRTGSYETLTGSVKLLMPGPAKFTEAVIPRGYKFDNTDEYPLVQPQATLVDLLSPKQYVGYRNRIGMREGARLANDVRLAAWNTAAEAGSLLGTIAGGVGALKSGFGVMMSAVGFLRDPAGVISSSLGISSGYLLNNPFKSLFHKRSDDAQAGVSSVSRTEVAKELQSAWARNPTMVKQKMKELGLENLTEGEQRELEEKLGVGAVSMRSAEYIRKALTEQGFDEVQAAGAATLKSNSKSQDRLNYIGAKAKEQNQSFQQVLDDERLQLDLFGDPDVEVDAGVVYESSSYLPKSTDTAYRDSFLESADYEKVYGDKDYSSLAQRPGVSTEVIQAVQEAYDNVNLNQSSEITEQSIAEVYGSECASTQARSVEEILAILSRVFAGTEQLSETTYGIRGIDDEDAEIEPVR